MSQSDYRVSVIIPCHNAKEILQPLVARIHQCPVPQIEIVVVDDASTDGMREMLENQMAGQLHRVVYLSGRRGVTGAVASGALAATGDYVVVQQPVLEFDPVDYPALLGPLLADDADAVLAHGEGLPAKPDKTTRLVSRAVGLRLPSLYSSAQAFSLPVLRTLNLQPDDLDFPLQAVARLVKKEYRLAHVALPQRSVPRPAVGGLSSVRAAWRAFQYAR